MRKDLDGNRAFASDGLPTFKPAASLRPAYAYARSECQGRPFAFRSTSVELSAMDIDDDRRGIFATLAMGALIRAHRIVSDVLVRLLGTDTSLLSDADLIHFTRTYDHYARLRRALQNAWERHVRLQAPTRQHIPRIPRWWPPAAPDPCSDAHR